MLLFLLSRTDIKHNVNFQCHKIIKSILPLNAAPFQDIWCCCRCRCCILKWTFAANNAITTILWCVLSYFMALPTNCRLCFCCHDFSILRIRYFWCNSSDPHCLLSLCLSLQIRVNKLSLVWTTNGCSWYDLPVYLVGIHENFCCGKESRSRLYRQELRTFFLFRILLGNHKKRKSRVFFMILFKEFVLYSIFFVSLNQSHFFRIIFKILFLFYFHHQTIKNWNSRMDETGNSILLNPVFFQNSLSKLKKENFTKFEFFE